MRKEQRETQSKWISVLSLSALLMFLLLRENVNLENVYWLAG